MLRLFAADDKTKNATTQQVGGLLFDVDEGVKIEHGPGGSVYVKSNREYIQEKFKTIDEKMESLEKRLTLVETQLAGEKEKDKKSQTAKLPTEKGADKENPEAENKESNKRVLVT